MYKGNFNRILTNEKPNNKQEKKVIENALWQKSYRHYDIIIHTNDENTVKTCQCYSYVHVFKFDMLNIDLHTNNMTCLFQSTQLG